MKTIELKSADGRNTPIDVSKTTIRSRCACGCGAKTGKFSKKHVLLLKSLIKAKRLLEDNVRFGPSWFPDKYQLCVQRDRVLVGCTTVCESTLNAILRVMK